MISAIASPNAELEISGVTGFRQGRHIDGRFHHGLDRWDGHIFGWLVGGHEGRIMPNCCDGQLAEDVTGATVAGSETERSDGEKDEAHSDLRLGRKRHPMGETLEMSKSLTKLRDVPACLFTTKRFGPKSDGDNVLEFANLGIHQRRVQQNFGPVFGCGFNQIPNHVSDLPRVHARGEIERSRALSSRLHCSANGRTRNA